MIVLRAKAIDFEVTYINLRDKPDWFLAISPHGKVPVLSVDDQPLFESNAIAEFLEETTEPRLHPADPVKRARNRAWTDFVPDFSGAIGKVTYCADEADLPAGKEAARKAFGRVEEALTRERDNDGPYFNGPELSLVDAAYAPFLQRFKMVDEKLGTGLLDEFPKLKAWAEALVSSEAVTGSVAESFRAEYAANLARRGAVAAPHFAAEAAAE